MEESVHSFRAGFTVTDEDQAKSHVLYRIRMGEYRAGDRLIPEEIAAEIDTSRMPVREAFRRLASEGLVVIRPNRGAIVRGLDADEMEEVFCMRGALEGLAAKMALPGIKPAHLAELGRLVEVMESHEQDAHQWVSAHRNFHEYLCQLSGKKRLISQIAGLHTVVEPHMRLWLQLAEKPMSSRDDHTTIIDAIKGGDAVAVEAVVREHIEATIPAIRKWMTSGR